MANFYEQVALGSGVNFGRTLIQARGNVGGHRHIFVNLQGDKNGLVFPPIGGKVVNPFRGRAKAYARDLVEYAIDGTCKIMKTYEVAADVADGEVTIQLVRDGYHHIPFVGDVIMVAPDTADAQGAAYAITAVKANKDNWEVTVAGSIGAVSKGDILVEGASAGASAKAMVANPNAFLPCDFDFAFEPSTGDEDFDGARYLLTPCLANEDTKLIEAKMIAVPAYVKAMNKSKVVGWFNL